jgi:TRAP-type C4-dicarboxylate transport system permease small subunit
MRLVIALERWAIRFTRVVAFLGLVALLALAGVILANAISRWLFSAPMAGVRDFQTLIIAIAIAACIPAVMAGRENITIRFVGRRLGPRAGVTLELLGAICGLGIMVLLAWELQVYVGQLWKSGQTTSTLGFRIAPWWQAVAVLFYLTVLVQTVVVVSLIASLIVGQRLERHALGEDPSEDLGATPRSPDNGARR